MTPVLLLALVAVSCANILQLPSESLLQIYDLDQDGHLNETEFTSMYDLMFPDLNAHLQEHQEESGNHTETCHTSHELFIEHDTSGDGLMNVTELNEVTPTLLLMVVACEIVEDTLICVPPTVSEKWGYGFLASVLVTLVSVVGVVLIPTKMFKIFPNVMEWLVSFAAGTLIGDAMLHLLPDMYGVHSHGVSSSTPDSHDHAVETPLTILADIGPSLVVCFTILGFYLLEKFVIKITGHEHSHLVDITTPKDEKNSDSDPEVDEEKGKHKHHHHISPVGYLSLVADGLHNFIDGLAIGVAFSISLNVGLVTTLAILAHEIPQEFGDFAVLLQSGFSKTKALLFNLASGAVCIVGTVIGLGLGEIEESEKWITAFVVGSFIYIPMANLIPELHKKNNWQNVLTQILGITAGFIVMLLIALYEISPEEC
eukprot:TRINITY_DN8810_c0_g1_i1.p1 TRINITY_DN8810_c0_g1~~TRINITY_DN8810_c0_g1_i1.p1  ORF type:complete len:436 (-),score=67.56 TRINITY_DN8810_c0_g1_i1:25-1305(-)